MLEMKEAAFICKHATEKSLILIDELGRATSNEDGVAIAWSISEHLLANRVMTFFVTHYPQLSKLSLVYPTVQNQHMDSIVSGEGSTELCYTHKIRSGPCKMTSDYGVEMAPTCGWPGDVVKEVSENGAITIFASSSYHKYCCCRSIVSLQARKIRAEVETKLPDGALCLVDSNGTCGTTETERRANELLQVIAQRLRTIGSMNTSGSFPVQDVRSALEVGLTYCTLILEENPHHL